MKLSFDARFCTLPATVSWTFPLKCLPLSSSSALAKVCSGWLPLDAPDVKIFLRSCCLLLLINNIASFMVLLSRDVDRAHQQRKISRYVPYVLTVLQTHSLLVLGYIWYRISNYQQVPELVHLLPVCLVLLVVDTCSAVAFYGSFRIVMAFLCRTLVVAFHAFAWLTLLFSLTCTIQREFIDCRFIA